MDSILTGVQDTKAILTLAAANMTATVIQMRLSLLQYVSYLDEVTNLKYIVL